MLVPKSIPGTVWNQSPQIKWAAYGPFGHVAAIGISKIRGHSIVKLLVQDHQVGSIWTLWGSTHPAKPRRLMLRPKCRSCRKPSAPKGPCKHNDPTNHDFWCPPHTRPCNQHVRSLCLCSLLGPQIHPGPNPQHPKYLQNKVLGLQNASHFPVV